MHYHSKLPKKFQREKKWGGSMYLKLWSAVKHSLVLFEMCDFLCAFLCTNIIFFSISLNNNYFKSELNFLYWYSNVTLRIASHFLSLCHFILVSFFCTYFDMSRVLFYISVSSVPFKRQKQAKNAIKSLKRNKARREWERESKFLIENQCVKKRKHTRRGALVCGSSFSKNSPIKAH